MGYEIFEGVRANHYDKNIRILFPQYEFLLALLGPIFKSEITSENKEKILVVGSGTGAEIESLYFQIPQLQFTGVDISPDMVKIAESRLRKTIPKSSFELVTGSVKDLSDVKKYKGATLLLVLHFLPDDGSKLKLLKEISARLSSSAQFVMADIFGNDGFFNYNLKLLEEYLIWTGKEKTVVHQLIEHFRNDIYYLTESRIVELLSQAGFIEAKRIFHSTIYGAWVARKA